MFLCNYAESKHANLKRTYEKNIWFTENTVSHQGYFSSITSVMSLADAISGTSQTSNFYTTVGELIQSEESPGLFNTNPIQPFKGKQYCIIHPAYKTLQSKANYCNANIKNGENRRTRLPEATRLSLVKFMAVSTQGSSVL